MRIAERAVIRHKLQRINRSSLTVLGPRSCWLFDCPITDIALVALYVPSSSVAVTLIVRFPVVVYVCEAPPPSPQRLLADPSPQSTTQMKSYRSPDQRRQHQVVLHQIARSDPNPKA